VEIEIVQRKENLLLKRVEVAFKATHKKEPTPSRESLRTELAKSLKATKDVVIVDGASSTFGRFETRGYAKIYKTKELAVSVERRHVLVRNKLAEPEAKPAAGTKPEKPAPPPKKEEAKAEPKPIAKAEAKPEKPAAKDEKKEAPKAERAPAKDEKHEEKKPAGKPEKGEAKKPEPKKKEGK
jgi:small subunit ribosomal protein S24e